MDERRAVTTQCTVCTGMPLWQGLEIVLRADFRLREAVSLLIFGRLWRVVRMLEALQVHSECPSCWRCIVMVHCVSAPPASLCSARAVSAAALGLGGYGHSRIHLRECVNRTRSPHRMVMKH